MRQYLLPCGLQEEFLGDINELSIPLINFNKNFISSQQILQ